MATRPAILGPNLRLGNFRLGYQPATLRPIREARVRIVLDGITATSRVRLSSLTIRDVLNDAPNTCSLVIDGTPAPESGMALRITINSNTPRLLFSGTIETDDVTYEGKPTQLCYPCNAIDDTARLNKRLPLGIWTNISATTVVTELVTLFAPGFTANNVQAALPAITVAFDGSEGFSGCLRQIVKLIGGYFYVEDRDLHLFLTEATEAPDTLDTTPGRFLNDPPITAPSEDSQLRTRVYGRGHADVLLEDVTAGETVLPIGDAVMFSATGGQVIASTTPDGSPTEILRYASVSLGGDGVLVGPGVSPSASPVLAARPGAGLSSGVYQYAYTFVTAVGETLPSPIGSVTTGAAFADPSAAPTGSLGNGPPGPFPFVVGDGIRRWAYTFTTAAGETLPSPTFALGPITFGGPYFAGIIFPAGPIGTTGRKLYRTVQGGAQLKLLTTIADNTTTGYEDHTLDGALGANAPVSSTTGTLNQVAVSGIATGPTGTTSRKLYRTAVGGAQLKVQSTIGDNSTTSLTDTTADGSLGANVPISNTSGLSANAAVGGAFFTASPVVFSTNGAATNANTASPVFTSASYTFVAADVGAFVFIKSGTNWTVGSYRIVSVAAGAATVAGPMASVASPTTATWGVDYSAFTTPRYSYTDLVIDAASTSKVTSAAQPFGVNTIGNVLSITGGVGFSVQQVVVISIAGAVATCDKVLGALSSTGGQGVLGLAPVQPFVYAGSTTLLTASTGPFSASGGWVEIDDQLVRYTGISGNSLTGIPASGTGALLTTVPYNTPVSAVPSLTGVTGLLKALQKGAPIFLWVQRDDMPAQNAAAARETTDDYTSDGVHEHILIDERRGEASLTALCDAELSLFADPLVTVLYATRDVKTKSGKPIVVNLPSPPISETLTIQDVTISEIDVAPGTLPRFTVSASSVRFSLEDTLRRMSALLPE